MPLQFSQSFRFLFLGSFMIKPNFHSSGNFSLCHASVGEWGSQPYFGKLSLSLREYRQDQELCSTWAYLIFPTGSLMGILNGSSGSTGSVRMSGVLGLHSKTRCKIRAISWFILVETYLWHFSVLAIGWFRFVGVRCWTLVLIASRICSSSRSDAFLHCLLTASDLFEWSGYLVKLLVSPVVMNRNTEQYFQDIRCLLFLAPKWTLENIFA